MAQPRGVVARLMLLSALVISTALVVVLARQRQSFEARYREVVARLQDPYVGMYVPAVRAPTLEGDLLLIGEAPHAGRQVLFVFNTSCAYCLASLPSWKAVAERLDGEANVGLYGVSTDSLAVTRAYTAEHGLGFAVETMTEAKVQALYHLQRVPQTLILDHEGRVIFTRLGPVEGDAAVDSIVAVAKGARPR